MIYTKNGTEALQKRGVVISPGTGLEHWGTVFFGPRSSTGVAPGPQATMSDMNTNETILPHFHGTSQFQLFAAGSGTIGKRGDVKTDDGMAAHVLRLGAGMAAMGPDPKMAGGYYVFVANGSLEKDGQEFPLWSMVVVESNEDGFEIRAGKNGLEALVLQYPREDE